LALIALILKFMQTWVLDPALCCQCEKHSELSYLVTRDGKKTEFLVQDRFRFFIYGIGKMLMWWSSVMD